ncbi:MAG: hypothetical protein GX287_01195 [Fusobacteria bacterium]|nr:hypothetical protein [Fusobacteriota bacterium]
MHNFIVDFFDENENIVISHEWYGYRKLVIEWVNKIVNWYEINENCILYPKIKKRKK